jgi:hypothetical protein
MLKAEMVVFIEERFTFGDHGESYHTVKKRKNEILHENRVCCQLHNEFN